MRFQFVLCVVSAAALLFASNARGGPCGNPVNPKQLTFARQEGDLLGTLGRMYETNLPYDIDTVVFELKKTGGKGSAGVKICREKDGKNELVEEFAIDNGDENQGKVWKRTISKVKGAMISVGVDGKSATNEFHYLIRLRRPTQGEIHEPITKGTPDTVINGFADLHNHMFGHLAFGGNYLWGRPDSPLVDCDGKSHGRATFYRDGKHTDRVDAGKDWPHYADDSHTMLHEGHLRKAMKGGLRLMVSYAVENWMMCKLAYDNGPCEEMRSVRRQLIAAHQFAAANSDWFQIVRDPWQARRAIAAGKLAVVLGVEISALMPAKFGKWQDQFDELYDFGVRSIELAHETDSEFAGSAIHHLGELKLYNTLVQLFGAELDDGWRKLGVALDKGNATNPLGLTSRGKELVRRMADRSMLIPIDHLSRAARGDLYDLVTDKYLDTEQSILNSQSMGKPPVTLEALKYYPLHASHTRFDELINHDDKEIHKEMGEYMITDSHAKRIMKTGGIVGLRTGENRLLEAKGSPKVANSCHGSSRSFAQLLRHGKGLGVHMAFGTDMNGFGMQVAPRYPGGRERPDGGHSDGGKAACPHGGTPDDLLADAPPASEFHTRGLAHIGFLGDLIEDLKRVVAKGEKDDYVEPLQRGAEHFLRMWERAYDEDRDGPVSEEEYNRWEKPGKAVKAKLLLGPKPGDPSD